jgi:molybdate/tungstate transport system substrate-binding protein
MNGKRLRLLAGIAMSLSIVLACSCGEGKKASASCDVRLFYAAGMAPVVQELVKQCRGDSIEVKAEGGGSLEVCRKVTELHRDADVLMLADNRLVATHLGGVCQWRIDFARDELVLGIGIHAPNVDKAERAWTEAIVDSAVRLARVDEKIGPLGYWTLIALTLQERSGPAGLCDLFVKRCAKVVDDAGRIVPLLKTGETDYAFLYRSTCTVNQIRFIPLDSTINLGSLNVNYGSARISYTVGNAESAKTVTVKGAPVVWSLCMPRTSLNADCARRMVARLLTNRASLLESRGFHCIDPPRVYGDTSGMGALATLVTLSGETL